MSCLLLFTVHRLLFVIPLSSLCYFCIIFVILFLSLLGHNYSLSCSFLPSLLLSLCLSGALAVLGAVAILRTLAVLLEAVAILKALVVLGAVAIPRALAVLGAIAILRVLVLLDASCTCPSFMYIWGAAPYITGIVMLFLH